MSVLIIMEQFDYKTDYKQSPLTPKPIVFKIVWAIIILLYSIALFNSFTKGIITRTLIILALCVIWLRLFFIKKQPKKSMFVIILLVLAVLSTTIKFYEVKPIYAKMQILFIIWLGVASYFNYYVITNN